MADKIIQNCVPDSPGASDYNEKTKFLCDGCGGIFRWSIIGCCLSQIVVERVWGGPFQVSSLNDIAWLCFLVPTVLGTQVQSI